MQRIIKWLRRDTAQQSFASEVDQRVKARPEQKKQDEYSDDSSYAWDAADRSENGDSSNDTPNPDQCDHEDTVRQTTLKLEDNPSSGTEEDVGVDPYNTGRFDTENK